MKYKLANIPERKLFRVVANVTITIVTRADSPEEAKSNMELSMQDAVDGIKNKSSHLDKWDSNFYDWQVDCVSDKPQLKLKNK